MGKEKSINYFSWFSIGVGIVHFSMETWFHFKIGQSVMQLIADYIGVFLLIFGGIKVLQSVRSIGLLCGAWGYSFCLNYRAFAWRMDAFTNGSSTEVMEKTLVVLGFTLIFSFCGFLFTFIQCYHHEKNERQYKANAVLAIVLGFGLMLGAGKNILNRPIHKPENLKVEKRK